MVAEEGSQPVIGSRLGPYEVTAKLGEGGMGVVYRAMDSRLGREVAVKVLPQGWTADPDRLARFEREAKLLAQLNHPHIAQVYGFEVSGETRALIMELVEGPTLAEALEGGPLPPEESLEIALQIAGALEAAHQKGIVHRDLKPHNIKMAMDGAFKVLDFGLAKALEPESGTPSRVAMSPTLTAGVTSHGMILGTAAYMAPEQAKGGAVDRRADIWAFGVVLYEMLSGRRLFLGDSVPETLAGVLKGEIDLEALPPGTPAALTRLLRRCLARDPQRRMRDAGDVRLELEDIRDAASPPVAAVSAARRSSRLTQVAALLTAAVVGAAAVAFWPGRGVHSVAAPPEVRFQLPPPSGTVFSNDMGGLSLAISPDGATLAFVAVESSNSRIWLRRIDGLETRPLPGTDDARSLTWSPDGRSIAFFAGDKLKRLDLDGGAAVAICDVPAWQGFAASWGAADQILLSSGQGEAISRVPAAGGPLETLLRPDSARHEVRVSWPRYFADGRGFLYLARDADYVSTLMQFEPGQSPRAVAPMVSRFDFVQPDLVVFARDGALLGQRFDRTAGRLVGAPISIAPAVRYFLPTSAASFAASPVGTLFYLSEQTSSGLVWVDREGRAAGSVGPPGDYYRLALSADGKSVLTDRMQPKLGTWNLWQLDVARGAEARVTSDSLSNFAGLWLGDDKSVVYSAMSARGWSPNLVRRNLGTGVEEALLPRNTFQHATDVSRDGRMLAFVERSEAGNFRAWILRLDGEARAEQLFQTSAQESQVRFAPGGTHVAYLSDESGSQTAYLSPLASPGVKTRLFAGAARIVRWRADGREILLLTPEGEMLAVPVGPPPGLEPGPPSILFTLPTGTFWRDFDVAPDGSRFLAIVRQRHGEAEPGTVILNWRPGQV